MTSDFSPLDRECNPADGFFGAISGNLFEENSAFVDVGDRWIDEALRAVPIPDGFLKRMSLLAQSVQTDAPSGSPA